MVKTKNGIKLPTTFRSGRFDEWKAKSRVSLPRVGEAENAMIRHKGMGRRFKHNKIIVARPLDKLRGDHEGTISISTDSRTSTRKKAAAEAAAFSDSPSLKAKKPGVRWSRKPCHCQEVVGLSRPRSYAKVQALAVTSMMSCGTTRCQRGSFRQTI